jgi:hypothetical protein
MIRTAIACRNERRREDVRSAPLAGLDYMEVCDDPRTLVVYLLGRLPDDFDPRCVRIEGGVRVRDFRIDVRPERRSEDDTDLDDRLVVRVDRVGDGSTYRLRIAALEDGRPTDHPPPGWDPRYDRLEFSFREGCETDLDCADGATCDEAHAAAGVPPAIDYLARDYGALRQLLFDRLSVTLPAWTERRAADVGVALVEVLAYVGDHLSYFQDAVGTEAYLGTARQRVSVRRHARLLDYAMHEGTNARTFVHLAVTDDVTLDLADVVLATEPPNGRLATIADLEERPIGYEVFQPAGAWAAWLAAFCGERTEPQFVARVHHDKIDVYTWRDTECCLPRGATRATLVDGDPPSADCTSASPARALALAPGDLLLFEEVKGPRTGQDADADLAHRHVVRLTAVEPAVDPLDGRPLLEVEWDQCDALPFDLCLSTLLDGDCAPIAGVSVARGNVLLVEHGRPIVESLGVVGVLEEPVPCLAEHLPDDPVIRPARFVPVLSTVPLTHAEPIAAGGAASHALHQDARRALPRIVIREEPAIRTDTGWQPTGEAHCWEPRADLLRSGPSDRHFVVETDDDGVARLRFGDGVIGRMPDAGSGLTAFYMVGNGPAGRVGAEAITVLRGRFSRVAGVAPRNPFPSTGGAAPESIADAKLNAPRVGGRPIARAIVAADYATIAERDPRMQRAAAQLAWTGAGWEAQVTIDALGRGEASPELCAHIARVLQCHRRLGHDVVVRPARYVPIRLVVRACAKPDASHSGIHRGLRRAIGALFAPDALTFGGSIHVSRIVAAGQAVPGVDFLKVERLERLYEGSNGEVDDGELVIGPFEIARLDQDPAFPEHGSMKILVEGGR